MRNICFHLETCLSGGRLKPFAAKIAAMGCLRASQSIDDTCGHTYESICEYYAHNSTYLVAIFIKFVYLQSTFFLFALPWRHAPILPSTLWTLRHFLRSNKFSMRHFFFLLRLSIVVIILFLITSPPIRSLPVWLRFPVVGDTYQLPLPPALSVCLSNSSILQTTFIYETNETNMIYLNIQIYIYIYRHYIVRRISYVFVFFCSTQNYRRCLRICLSLLWVMHLLQNSKR